MVIGGVALCMPNRAIDNDLAAHAKTKRHRRLKTQTVIPEYALPDGFNRVLLKSGSTRRNLARTHARRGGVFNVPDALYEQIGPLKRRLRA